MNYDYSYYSDMGDAAIVGGLVAVLLIFYVLMLAFLVVSYVLQALGMYSIAKRRGIHKPWLAWIPVANTWLLGSISDQYQYVVKGRVRNRRKALLGLNIAMYALMIPVYIAYFFLMFSTMSVSGAASPTFAVPLVILTVCGLAYMVVAVTAVVFQYIALYDLYVSSSPENAVLYLVLSIFLSVTLPFFVFACRKKDQGMPPRKAPQPVAPVIAEPAAAPEAEEVLSETPKAEEVPAEAPEAEEIPVAEEVSAEVPAEEPAEE